MRFCHLGGRLLIRGCQILRRYCTDTSGRWKNSRSQPGRTHNVKPPIRCDGFEGGNILESRRGALRLKDRTRLLDRVRL